MSLDDLIAQRVVGNFPTFTTDDLRICSRHNRAGALSSCVNLANPATGSTSLEKAFSTEPALSNYSTWSRKDLFFAGNMPGRGTPQSLMHSHSFNALSQQKFMRKRRLPQPRCYVMTIRDPAERFESGFREGYLHFDRLVRSLAAARLTRKKWTAHNFLELTRNASRCEPTARIPTNLH